MDELIKYKSLKDSLSKDNKFIPISNLLPRAAKKWPHKIALICQSKDKHDQINYSDLYKKAKICANKYKELGILKNDRVIIYYENSIEFYCIYFGLWHIGAIVIPLNVYLKQPEVINIIKDATPKAIVISSTLQEKLTEEIDNNIILINNIPEILIPKSEIDIDIDPIDKDEEEIASILYTSGTTGTPKGVMLTGKNIITNTLQGTSRFDLLENESVYCPLPLFHSLPQNMCMWVTTIVGATAIIVSKIDRTTLVKAFKHNPTFIITVPAMYGLFCKLKNLDFSNFKYCFSGGDVLPDKIQKYFELIYRRKISNGFGLTETSPFISINTDEWTTATSNVGKPFIGMMVEIRDDNGQILPENQIGVIWLKGDNVMKGYYNAPDATQKVLHNSWLNTGDLGYLNDDNEIVLSGRAKDLIINKGVKIYPQEIEAVLYKHPEVLQVAIVGKKEADGTEEIPIAFIGSNSKDLIKLEEELKDLIKNNLASYKVPRQLIIKTELPMTATGKIDKKALRQELIK